MTPTSVFTIGDPTQWRLKRALAGGGPLMDVGIYALQATRYLTGEEPISVSAISTVTDPVKFNEVEESIVWESKFPGGVIAHCGTTYNAFAWREFQSVRKQRLIQSRSRLWLRWHSWPAQ
ncbi:MAG: Gfo/Idh/MocA family oxidoreductase [Limisphaerales bacterium]